jgi:hypothetical protein
MSSVRLADLDGARVKSAQSSLDTFAVIFDDGRGLLVNAVVDEGECGISAKIVPAEDITPPSEAVCSVDWSWIYGQSVAAGGLKQSFGMTPTLKVNLTTIGTITVAVGVWQGKPFLSFMPYKPKS